MADSGTIVVRVYTSRAQIPIMGASVALTRPGANTGRPEVLALRITDENGLTAPLSIPAPPAAESTTPGTEGPFTALDVWVEHPEYQMLRVENVQIFAGVETRQDAELIPLPEHPDKRDMTSTVIQTPQPL